MLYIMAKKRAGVVRKRAARKIINYSDRQASTGKIKMVLKSLLLFVVLSLVFFILYLVNNIELYNYLFYLLFVLFGCVSLGFLFALLILFFMKLIRG